MKILVVDDSVVARSLLKQVLSGISGITGVDSAANGIIALEKIKQGHFDLVILDLEMPELDGLGTLSALKAENIGVRVIIFASETPSGTNKTIQAFRLGAWDVIAKPKSESFKPEELVENIRTHLAPKIIQLLGLAKQNLAPQNVTIRQDQPKSKYPQISFQGFKPKVIVIASSTGGPSALEQALAKLNGKAHIPLLIVQHMPPFFTKGLAKNIAQISGLPCDEALHDEPIMGGKIYVAPGDYHMSIKNSLVKPKIIIDQDPPIHSVRPAAEKLFISAAEAYGNEVLGFVLTGMGEDGRDGAIAIKKAGGAIVIQDKKTSVVWGMPGAVHSAEAFDKVLNLEEIAQLIAEFAHQ